MSEDLRAQLRRHEGYKTHLYRCTEGYQTIGIGYNIQVRGLPQDIIETLFNRDVLQCQAAAWEVVGPQYNNLSQRRQDVVTNMVFQMGAAGVSKFKNFLTALRAHDYEMAADEMLDSRWAKQTPNRANELAQQMREG